MKNGEADATRRAKVVSVPALCAEWRTDPAFLLDQIRQGKLRAVDPSRAPRGRMPFIERAEANRWLQWRAAGGR